jgi:hypothetical protein
MSIDLMNTRALITCDNGCGAQEEHGANLTPHPNGRGADIKIFSLPRIAKTESGEKKSRLGRRATDAETWHREESKLATQPPRFICPECKIKLGLWPPAAPAAKP